MSSLEALVWRIGDEIQEAALPEEGVEAGAWPASGSTQSPWVIMKNQPNGRSVSRPTVSMLSGDMSRRSCGWPGP